MIIVGISVARMPIRAIMEKISTAWQSLETTLEDVTMIIDRVVAGFCPQSNSGEISSQRNKLQKMTNNLNFNIQIKHAELPVQDE